MQTPAGVGRLWKELIAAGYQGDQFVQTERLGGRKVAGIGLITIHPQEHTPECQKASSLPPR